MDLFHFREESPGSVFGMKRLDVIQRLVEYIENEAKISRLQRD